MSRDRWDHSLYHTGFGKHVATLTPSQQAFPYLLDEWIRNPQRMVVIVAGGPGSGKTYTVTSCLDRVQIAQLRMAPTARVAQRIRGSTIHSALRLAWNKGTPLDRIEKELENVADPDVCIANSAELLELFDCRESPQIVMIDEVGMVHFYIIHWICQYFFSFPHPILLVVLGDPNQLRPVKGIDNVFGIPLQFRVKRINFLESKRFTVDYIPFIEKLRQYVDANDETECFAYIICHFPVVQEITATILKQCTRAMAHVNLTVEKYNKFYLKHFIKGKAQKLWSKDGSKHVLVKPGCLIFVTQNMNDRVKNGTPLIFQRHEKNGDYLECQSIDKNETAVFKIPRNLQGHFPIVVGFAGTIHKFQGETMDDAAIAINFNGSRDLNLVYTALSRVKSMQQIVAIQL